MPKTVNYPRKPFETALNIAENVEKLGGKCSEQLLGDKLGKKKGGSFTADITSAIKHNLINREKDTLKITDLYKEIKLSYTDEERHLNLVKAFLAPDTYNEILERFNGKELPIEVLDKMLIKEYDVATNVSQYVANNLIKGAESLKLIINGFVKLSLDDKNENSERDKDNLDVNKNDNEKNNVKGENNLDGENKVSKKSLLTDKLHLPSNFQKDVIININIQLTVPETTNEDVYEKFFSAMKKNLLS